MSKTTVRVVTDINETIYVTPEGDDFHVMIIDEDKHVAELILTPRDVEALQGAFHEEPE